MRLYAYCLMPNHWHLVVSPEVDGEMSRFGQWLGLTHTQRHHAHYQTTGYGHLYQGRFKSFPVQDDPQFLGVRRYVEQIVYTAKYCKAPDRWRFGSLWRWSHGNREKKEILSPWPIHRLPDWIARVRAPITAKELKRLQGSIQHDAPFGEATWVATTARRLQQESTMRPRGRPKKLPNPP